ncbi:MAG: SUMF1/EgtB/PvdO family nonheme iron enzyme [Sedimenticola sp.]|nr:SUMF1/EgtB/PvdO family nonheme iron enzyme [Sedimenticola sp.]
MAVVPKQNGLDILRKLVPLNTLTEETLAELMDTVEFEKVSKGAFIFREGDSSPERIYLLSGKVALLEAGKEIDTVAAGTNMARYPVAHHIPRRYSVQAKTRAEVVRIGNRLLSDLLSRGGNALYQVEELNTESEDDWMSQLLQSPIFQRIPAANIQNIMMRMEEMPVSSGEIVIRQGDEGDFFYLINRGQCAITKEQEDGEIAEIARLGPGDSVGEESLLSGQKRGSTVSMLTDGVLFRLGKKDFIEYIKLPLANAIGYEAALDKVSKGAVWLDVRSALEYERSHIPQSINIPFNDLRSKVSELDSNKTYVVYCQDGLVSSTAIYLLMERDLDGFVLERGLESVPDEIVNKERTQDGAQIINFRPDLDDSATTQIDSSTAPDDEASLLRERLHKTEAQAQEQLQRARKMKLMLEKLKGRLAEAEEEGGKESKERQRLAGEIESLQHRLRERDEAHGALKQKQSAVNEQLSDLKAERDQLQDELTKMCQQVGKLEKRLEAKQQEEEALKSLQSESQQKAQALIELKSELDTERSNRLQSDEQNKSLQLALEETRAEINKLNNELQTRDTSIEQLEQQQQSVEAAQTELETERTSLQNEGQKLQSELDQARAEIDRLTGELATQVQAIQALDGQQHTLAETQLELDRLNRELQARDESLQQLQQNQQLLDANQSEVAALETARAALETEHTALKSELELAQTEIKQLTVEITDHTEANQKQKSELERLERELKEAQNSVISLQAEQSQAGESELSLKASLETAESRIAELESEISSRESDENERAEKLTLLEKQQLLLNSEIDQLRGELEGASAQVAALESERNEAEKLFQQNKTELESTLKQSLYEAVEGRTHAENELRNITDERDRLTAELSVLKTHHEQLLRQADEHQQALAELEGEKATAGSEVLLSSQVEQARLAEALDKASAELTGLQASIEEKDQTLAELSKTLNEKQQEEEQASTRLLDAENELKTLQAASKELNENLLNLQAEKERIETEFEAGQQVIVDLQSRLAAAESQELQESAELSSLRAELEEMAAAKAAAEEAVALAQSRSAKGSGVNADVKVLQAELATLNDALDEADHSYEQLNKEKLALEGELSRLQADASNVVEASHKEAAEQEVTRLTAELERLQEQLSSNESSSEKIAALESELALVRERTEIDLGQMRSALEAAEKGEGGVQPVVTSAELDTLRAELDEARMSLKELELSSSADAAESEVLRQDIDKLTRSLDERSAELEKARKQSLLLEEKTEERNSEIDRLKLALEAAQVDADEAQFKKDEALEARKQVEEALYKLQKQVESERPRDDLLDKRVASNDAAFSIPQQGGRKSAFSALLIGAVLAFAGAEALSILSGKGEIVSGFMDGQDAAVLRESAAPAESSRELVPTPVIDTPAPSPSQIAITKTPSAETVTERAEPEVLTKPIITPPPPVVTRREPVVAKTPPKPKEPETGSPIQDRLFDGGSGPEMLYVRGGTFEMGSRINHLSSEELPVHEVRLGSYSIGKYEVTFREYELFAAATGRPLPDDLGWGQGPRPVINVSWNDAKAYTVWLSEQTGKRYRLPTEAEWEYAAASGTDTPYWWGFDLGSENANCFNCGSQWDGVSTAPVGRFESNAYGLHNTAGNVMEWVEDCYHNSYEGAPTDGSSWQELGCSERVIRGGAFNKPGESLRVTKRGRYDADAKLFVLGFRVARDVR